MSISPNDIREELGSPSQDDISDETLQRLIDEEKTLYGAAYRAALIIARKYAFQTDYRRGNVQESLSQVSQAWHKLADELKVKAALYGGTGAFAGGTQKPVKPDFWKGMWDNRYT